MTMSVSVIFRTVIVITTVALSMRMTMTTRVVLRRVTMVMVTMMTSKCRIIIMMGDIDSNNHNFYDDDVNTHIINNSFNSFVGETNLKFNAY